jgi:hypothetical protein
MAEVLEDYVVSDMPDLTQTSLEVLSAVLVPQECTVLEWAIAHPAQDWQEQRG